MSENFLSRWSKRKLEVRAQEKLAEEGPVQQANVLPSGLNAGLNAGLDDGQGAASNQLAATTPPAKALPEPELPLPTEADLLAVKQGGDIKAFMVDKVSTELRNKAFKALFSRPEFNVMDGLDIYIDDYNKFTPLSKEDIGKMTLSKQLLSRPDLEIPEKGDINAGLEKLEEVVATQDDPVPAVLDKTDERNKVAPEESDAVNEVRVIPDNSQAADLNGELENRTFEIPDKK